MSLGGRRAEVTEMLCVCGWVSCACVWENGMGVAVDVAGMGGTVCVCMKGDGRRRRGIGGVGIGRWRCPDGRCG